MRHIEVNKHDLLKIGNSMIGDDNGNTVIICNVNTANIEEILLRNILKEFGDEYKILGVDDFSWNEEDAKNFNADIRFVTNLPYSIVTDLFNIDCNE